jgi:hypothetical protein
MRPVRRGNKDDKDGKKEKPITGKDARSVFGFEESYLLECGGLTPLW